MKILNRLRRVANSHYRTWFHLLPTSVPTRPRYEKFQTNKIRGFTKLPYPEDPVEFYEDGDILLFYASGGIWHYFCQVGSPSGV